MPKNHHEIMNQNEEEKQPLDNQKFTLIKKSMNKPLIKGNITSTSKYKNNQIIENIKDNMKMIEHVAMENILMAMVQCIMVIGMMICNLELDMKYGEILHNIQGNIIMEKKMV